MMEITINVHTSIKSMFVIGIQFNQSNFGIIPDFFITTLNSLNFV